MSMFYGFELLREQTLPEITSYARFYRHARTGAELLTLTNDDPNKTFCVAFRILPKDDTGVAHILEHCMLLGGSRKYPVRELFVELIKGSLATFINGIMHFDKTVYPCASQNLQDFYNLMDVYLDTLLHPRLTRQTFEQEGWRYELEDLDAPLTYRGVVFNEVKTGYTTAGEVLPAETRRALFPDVVYGRHVGGHPRYLPDLTYEQLLEFHAAHYHPSNSRFFLYGDLPLEECLRRVDAYLQEFDRAPASPEVPLQPPFEAPRTVTAPYQPTDEDAAGDKLSETKSRVAGAYVTVNWVLAENDNPARTLALEVLREALIGFPAAHLSKALLDSGLGDNLAGLGEWLPMAKLRQLDFSAGLKGVASENVERVAPLILDTLETLTEEGLARQMLEAALNTVEFRLRENNPGGWIAGQRGFALMMRALSTWIYDRDPLALVAFEGPLTTVKEKCSEDPRYFEGLIRTYLLENPHRVTLHLQPDPGLLQREAAEEKERLSRAYAAMSTAELQAIVENTRTLKKLQGMPNSREVLATLPTLKRSDLEREVMRIPLEIGEEAQTWVFYHPLHTNGVVYLDLGFNLRALPQSHLPYAMVFGRALLEMGTQTQDFVQLAQRMGRFTGGIQHEVLASESRGDGLGPVWLFLRGKATADKGGELLSILRDLLSTVNLDNREHFRQIVQKEKARREASLPYSPQILNRRLRAHFTEPDWVNDQLTGLGGLFFLRRLAREVESDWHAVLDRLQTLRAALVNRNAMMANVTLDASAWAHFRPALADFLADLPLAPVEHAQWTRPILATNEGFAIPSQVNYIGKGANLFELGYTLHGSALAVKKYLNTTWLWDKIRAEGGAYGVDATFDHLSGVFVYLSYYNPNLLSTLEVYDGTSDFLRHLELSEDELTRSVIGAIGEMDKYQLPDAKGFTSMARYLAGDNDERRQRLREELLSTTPAHFKAFADVLDAVRRDGHVVIMAAEKSLRDVNEQQGSGWLKIKRAL